MIIVAGWIQPDPDWRGIETGSNYLTIGVYFSEFLCADFVGADMVFPGVVAGVQTER